MLVEIPSGQIAPNVSYQVIGGTSITYDSVVYNAGQFFIGVDGVTTYSESGGAKVYESSEFLGTVLAFEHYQGEYGYPEDSFFLGTVFGLGEALPYYLSYTVTERKQNATPNGFNEFGYKLRINSNNDQYITELTGQTAASAALTYDEIKSMFENNNNVQADIDGDGIITNFKVARFN